MVDYSTLELVRHDATANAPEHVQRYETADAPERDNGPVAPQLDHTRNAPELDYASGLQGADESPIAVGDSNGVEKEARFSEQSADGPFWRKRKRTIAIVVISCGIIVLAAIGIGLGVGLGLKNNRNSSRNNLLQDPGSSTVSATAILNDTSLAAVTTANGDRHLFFQDQQGDIRRVLFDSVANEWISDRDQIIVSDARMYTPISAQAINLSPTDPMSEVIRVHYLSPNNAIGAYTIALYERDISPAEGLFAGIQTYTSSPTARSLSVSYRDTHWVDSINNESHDSVEVIVIIEQPGDGLAVLLGNGSFNSDSAPQFDSSIGVPLNTGDESRLAWRDVTEAAISYFDNDGLGTDPSRIAHFVGMNVPVNATQSRIEMIFFVSYTNPDTTIVSWADYDGNSMDILGSYAIGRTEDDDLQQSDIAITRPVEDTGGIREYIAWIQNSKLYDRDNEPVSDFAQETFPFPRLATIVGISRSYIYNQINHSTFAERSWNSKLRTWNSTSYFTVEI